LPLACVFACAPDGEPLRMVVLDLAHGGVAYDLKVVELHTLEDVRELRGEAVRPIGSAVIRIDARRIASATTEDEMREALLAEPGRAVEAQFIESDGVLYPSDFHSLSLATAYHAFEKAREYALARGMSRDTLREAPFYYFPKMTDDPARGYAADNAAWIVPLRSFLVLPFERLQAIPLAVNRGVIAHEYAHGIFNAEVLGGDWWPRYLDRWGEFSAGAIMLRSIDEGFADAWALGSAGDLGFIERSLGAAEASARDTAFDAGKHCHSQDGFDAELERTRRWPVRQREEYWASRPYRIGTMWAAALERAGARAGAGGYDRVMDALFASYRTAGEASLATLVERDVDGARVGSFAAIGAAIVAGANDAAAREALCATLMDRFSLLPSDLGACDGVSPGRECR
ncbi:MAG TPA: hypothetical protein VGD74_12630, partial [Vulgatibacter sp.]